MFRRNISQKHFFVSDECSSCMNNTGFVRMKSNGKVIRIEDRPNQERIFLHVEATDEAGLYGTLVSFSYDELTVAGIADYDAFLGMECICDPYPHREDFGVLS